MLKGICSCQSVPSLSNIFTGSAIWTHLKHSKLSFYNRTFWVMVADVIEPKEGLYHALLSREMKTFEKPLGELTYYPFLNIIVKDPKISSDEWLQGEFP